MIGCRNRLLLQLPPIEPGMRFSRTRLTEPTPFTCGVRPHPPGLVRPGGDDDSIE
jgi:hypothetical protein